MYVSILQNFLIILKMVHLNLQLLMVLRKAVLRHDNFENILTTQDSLSVVLYGCETWSLTLREEHRLRVLETGVMRKIFGHESGKVRRNCRRLCNEEFYDLCSSPYVIRMNKSRRMKWDGHVARMGVGEERIGFWLGPRRGRKGSIKTYNHLVRRT